jgi:hypothetical protein
MDTNKSFTVNNAVNNAVMPFQIGRPFLEASASLRKEIDLELFAVAKEQERVERHHSAPLLLQLDSCYS